ncbi:hypothetical protein K8R32_01665 [bacterium]|nr:hypothetical protein [bacterium]
MKKQNNFELEKEIDRKYIKKDMRKKKKMKVSGGQTKELQKIISNRAN